MVGPKEYDLSIIPSHLDVGLSYMATLWWESGFDLMTLITLQLRLRFCSHVMLPESRVSSSARHTSVPTVNGPNGPRHMRTVWLGTLVSIPILLLLYFIAYSLPDVYNSGIQDGDYCAIMSIRVALRCSEMFGFSSLNSGPDAPTARLLVPRLSVEP